MNRPGVGITTILASQTCTVAASPINNGQMGFVTMIDFIRSTMLDRTQRIESIVYCRLTASLVVGIEDGANAHMSVKQIL